MDSYKGFPLVIAVNNVPLKIDRSCEFKELWVWLR